MRGAALAMLSIFTWGCLPGIDSDPNRRRRVGGSADARTVDGSSDGSFSDGSVQDAGGIDANGLDAGGLDAGGLDATTVDATSKDATTEDATTKDAATEDATTEDATTEDATTEDAATKDATAEDAMAEDAMAEDASSDGDTGPDGGEPDATSDVGLTDAGLTDAGLTDAGPDCGNNQIDTPEVCDGTQLNGQNCGLRGYGGGALACASDCMDYDESGCWYPPTASTPVEIYSGEVGTFYEISPAGDYVAFITDEVSFQMGTLRYAPTTGGTIPLNLGDGVDALGFGFSPDGNHFVWLFDAGPQPGDGTRSLARRPVTGGSTIGTDTQWNYHITFTPDSRYLVYIDGWDRVGYGGGTLKVLDLLSSATTMGPTNVNDFTLSPDGLNVAYSTNFSYPSGLVDVSMARVPSLQTFSIGYGSPSALSGHNCVKFTPDGGRLFVLDQIQGGSGYTAYGRLRSTDTTSLSGHTHSTSAFCTQSFSSDGLRTIYGDGVTSDVVWQSTSGGPMVLLGQSVSRPYPFDSSRVFFVNNYDSSFPSWGSLNYYDAGTKSPVGVATTVLASWANAPDGLTFSYVAAYDFGMERGDLYIMNRSTAQAVFVEGSAHRNVLYSPDSNWITYTGNYNVSTVTGTLKVASVSSPGTAYTVSTTAYPAGRFLNNDKIIYTENYNASTGAGDIMIADRDGSNPILIASNRWLDSLSVDESGDFAAIVLTVSSSDYLGELWVVDLHSGGRTLVENRVLSHGVDWLPGTTRLFYHVPPGLLRQGLWTSEITP